MKNKNLANQVKELRKRKGFSQEELTSITGLSLRTVQRIESGETEPRGDTIIRLSNALDVTPDQLIDWAIKEDKGFLKAMNLSTLTFIVFPLLGILTPLVMWISMKDKLRSVNKLGKTIINFEITWVILLFSGFILNSLILSNKLNSIEEVSPAIVSMLNYHIIFFSIMYAFNFLLILFNAYRIHKGLDVKYYPKVDFLRY